MTRKGLHAFVWFGIILKCHSNLFLILVRRPLQLMGIEFTIYEKLKLIDYIQMDEELFHCLGSWIRGAASNEKSSSVILKIEGKNGPMVVSREVFICGDWGAPRIIIWLISLNGHPNWEDFPLRNRIHHLENLSCKTDSIIEVIQCDRHATWLCNLLL